MNMQGSFQICLRYTGKHLFISTAPSDPGMSGNILTSLPGFPALNIMIQQTRKHPPIASFSHQTTGMLFINKPINPYPRLLAGQR